MGKDNVFLNDIDVPEVVREKMDAAFSIIKKERENTMKKEQVIEKRADNTEKKKNGNDKKNAVKRIFTGIMAASAAAACVAIMVMNAVSKSGEKSIGLEKTPLVAENEGMAVTEETFTLKIMGSELEKDKPVQLVASDSFLTEKNANTWVMEGMEGGGVSYCINVPFTCQGNNIKNVTYSINHGAFQVVQPEGESIIVDGQLYDGELNTGSIGGYDDESEAGDGTSARTFETVLYKSFTLDYQKQSDENTWINICNTRTDNGELESLIFGYTTLENKNLGIQKMLDNTTITCTVSYADGTTGSVDVLVNSCIMTCAEAGAEIKDDPNREEIFITFELK